MMGAPMGAASLEPVALDLDFNYEDDVTPVSAEAMGEAKRRRLEEERRVNEAPAMAGAAAAPAIMQQIQGLINDPESIQQVLHAANLTMDELIDSLAPHAPRDFIEQLRTVKRRLEQGEMDVERVVEENGERFLERWSTTVYVGNVPHSITEADLRLHFDSFGRITNISFRPDNGIAFITFSRREGTFFFSLSLSLFKCSIDLPRCGKLPDGDDEFSDERPHSQDGVGARSRHARRLV